VHHGTFAAYSLVAGEGLAGAAHACAEAAAHSLLKAVLSLCLCRAAYGSEHRLGAAGIKEAVIKSRHCVGDEAFYAVTAVRGCHIHVRAESLELIFVKHILA